MKALKYLVAGVALFTAATSGLMMTGCTNLDESPYTFMDPNSYYTNEA